MSKRHNGEGSWSKVTKNGHEYFRYRVMTGNDTLTGKPLFKEFYGKTKSDVQFKITEFEKKKSYNSNNDMTLAEYFHTWLFEFRKQELKASSFERYEGIYRNYIKSNAKLSNTKLINLDTPTLQKYYNALIKSGKEPSTVKNVNGYIKTCLADAVKDGHIIVNPCINVRFPKNHNIEEDNNIKFLDVSYQKLLLDAITGDSLELFFLFGLLCGMRLGEIYALTTKDIDFNNNWININKSMKRVYTIASDGTRKHELQTTIPKTKNSIRKVPLPKVMIPKLEKLISKKKTDKLEKGELYYLTEKDSILLFSDDNGLPIDSKLPNRRLKGYCKKLGIPVIRFHDLRHTFISNCVNADINPKTVATIVGHSSIDVTLNIYSHLSESKLFDDMQKVNDLLEKSAR